MSIWHLLWIIPLSASAGFLVATTLAVARDEDQEWHGNQEKEG